MLKTAIFRFVLTLLLCHFVIELSAQATISGKLQDANAEPVLFANVALFAQTDSSLVKVEATDEHGVFRLQNIGAGQYFIKATFVGYPELVKGNVRVSEDENVDLGTLTFASSSIDLDEATVTAKRVMVVVEPDRTVFNVQGTINSVGSDAISLLRKAPAVTVDNNDNINVLGRSGVKVFVDGKELPLSGEDLSNYLKNLSADQIDRIEIITSPGAKYEAEGNAGIIDIRLKKDDSVGAYGSLSGTFTQGILTRYNLNASGNYRNKKFNVFGTAGYNVNDNFHNINFESYQNNLYLQEINNTQNNQNIYNYRLGTDFFLNKKNTIGFLVGGRIFDGEEISYNRIAISPPNAYDDIESILVANNTGERSRNQNTYNINYRFYKDKGASMNIDLDYGKYINKRKRYQPNRYYNSTEDSILSQVIREFETPNTIEIYTGKIDYEKTFKKTKWSIGSKYSQVETANTFNVFDVADNNISVLNDTVSNHFQYQEKVLAGYLNLARPLSKKVSLSAGIRAENTRTVGTLTAYLESLQEDPIFSNYLNWFPSAGISWKIAETKNLTFNYGRRINRPDYNVLNPFRNQLSELSIEKGNPELLPEIVNNLEMGFTLNYKYNFKIAYSKTDDKITRLIGPDDVDPRAGFISWDNLATETVWSASASLPVEIKKWWNAYFNLSTSHINNQANYGGDAIVDVQVLTYSIYQQHSFKLPKGFKGELSSYYSGPGVWGGVFKYDANWNLDAGLQKMFWKNKLSAKLTFANIFNQIGWKGSSEFNGLTSYGNGRWDSRFVSLSLKYSVGNKKAKSNKRKTGIESEEKRVG